MFGQEIYSFLRNLEVKHNIQIYFAHLLTAKLSFDYREKTNEKRTEYYIGSDDVGFSCVNELAT